MQKIVGVFLLTGLLSLYGCSNHPAKQETISTEGAINKTTDVVARVNGQPITESAIKNLQIETAMYNRRLKVPREKMIKELIERELLYQEAIAKGFGNAPAVVEQIKVASRAIVSKAYMRTLVNNTNVSKKEIKDEYERRLKSADLTQFQLSQIMVNSEQEAIKIIGQLDKSIDFKQLAIKFSKGSNAAKGGDLGWRRSNQMDPQTAQAIKLLKPGEYTTKPVKTAFGWQVVLLNNVREQEASSLDKMEHSLGSILRRQKLKEYIKTLASKSDIQYLKPSPKSEEVSKAVTDKENHHH